MGCEFARREQSRKMAGRIDFKHPEGNSAASYDQPGCFDQGVKAGMSSMVASRKERFHVKQAQPDTTEVAPGIGDSAAGPPTDNFAKMDPRFKDPKVQLPDYKASPAGRFEGRQCERRGLADEARRRRRPGNVR